MSGFLAVVVEPGADFPVAQVGRILAYHLDTHPTDAITRVRYGKGIIVERVDQARADGIRESLENIGVPSHIVPVSSLARDNLPRGIRARRIDTSSDGIKVHLVGGRQVDIDRADLHAIDVYAQPAEVDSTLRADAPRDGASEHEHLLKRPPQEFAADLLTGQGLSPRGQRLLDAIQDAGLPELRFHIALFASSPFGPVRASQNDFDFSGLGAQLQGHSVDNFLLMVEELLATLTEDAWNRTHVRQFLDDLTPRSIFRLKEEETSNFHRWLLHWVRARWGSEAESSL